MFDTLTTLQRDAWARIDALRDDIAGTTDPEARARLIQQLDCLDNLHRHLSHAQMAVERADYWQAAPSATNPMAAVVAALGGLD